MPHAGQLLGARKIVPAFFDQCLDPLAVGDVGDRPDHANRAVCGIAGYAAAAAHPAIVAVLMAQPELPLDAGLTALHFQIFAASVFQARPVVGMDQFENCRKVIGEFVVGIAQDALPARRQVTFAGRDVGVPYAVFHGACDSVPGCGREPPPLGRARPT